MEYLGIFKEVKTFFRELVVFVNDNFVSSLVYFLEYKSFYSIYFKHRLVPVR